MTDADRTAQLAALLAAGLIDGDDVLDELQDVTLGDPLQLIKTLFPAGDKRDALLERVHQRRYYLALDWHRALTRQHRPIRPSGLADLPAMTTSMQPFADLQPHATRLSALLADQLFLRQHDENLPQTRALLDQALAQACKDTVLSDARLLRICCLALAGHWPQELLETVAAELDERLAPPEDLDLCAVSEDPLDLHGLFLLDLDQEQQERLQLIWTCRFGEQASDWHAWHKWMATQFRILPLTQDYHSVPAQCLTAWLLCHSDHDAAAGEDALKRCIGDHVTRAAVFAERWADEMPAVERQRLLGDGRHHARVLETVNEADDAGASVSSAGHETEFETRPEQQSRRTAAAQAGSVRAPESEWQQHVRSFINENVLLLFGGLSVIGGSAILAYFTWEKHWIWRFTVLPLTLALLTWFLAWAGRWLQRRDESLRGTAAVLCGLAISLLPMHALVPALLAGDADVTAKAVTLPLALVMYLMVIVLALRRWTAAVHPRFTSYLTQSLALNCVLVVLTPLLFWLGLVSNAALVIPALMYLGAAAAGRSVHLFTRDLEEHEDLRGERFAWFAGATLALTLLQAIAWSHALLVSIPEPAAYAPMLVMAGWLILLVERRFLQRQGRRSERLHNESFIGFAAIIAGIAMSFEDPWWRLLTLICSAAAWFDQSRARQQVVHWWIACLLTAAAGVAVAALPVIADSCRAACIVVVAAIMLLAGRRLQERVQELASALASSSIALAVIALGVAVVLQWHSGFAPWISALSITGAMLLTLIQACCQERQRWVLLAACMSVMALPYYGCIDLESRSFYGNHMVFGLTVLSLLWAGIGRLPGAAVIARTRSLIGMALGVLAVMTLLVRVGLEGGRPAETDAWHMFLDYGGSLGMAGVLIAVAWWSRSLIPGMLSAVVLVILFPELKAQFSAGLEYLGWGSGLGSAASAAGLIIAAFWARHAGFLQQLHGSDPLFHERRFPWQRFDFTLVTWPLLAAAVFLLLKVDSLTVLRTLRLDSEAVPVRSLIAFFLSSLSWLAVLYYRGPRHAPQRLRRWCRVFASLMLAWSLMISVCALLPWLDPDYYWAERLAWPLFAVAVLSLLLRLHSNWSMRNAAARLDQIASRLAPVPGVIVLGALLFGSNPSVLTLTTVIVAALALRDAASSGQSMRGAWFWLLAWSWYLCWSIWGNNQGKHDYSWWTQIDIGFIHQLTLGLAVIMLLQFVREFFYRRELFAACDRGVAEPMQALAQLLLAGLSLLLFILFLNGRAEPTLGWYVLVMLLALLQAWLQSSWIWAAVAMFLCWSCVQHQEVIAVTDDRERLLQIIQPLSLAFLGSLLALLPSAADRLCQLLPTLLPQVKALLPSGDRLLVLVLALTCTAGGMLLITVHVDYRAQPQDLAGAYALLLPCLLVLFHARCLQAAWLLLVSALVLANTLLIELCFGEQLHELGLYRAHFIAMGLALTALLLSLCARLLPVLLYPVRRSNVVLSAFILLVLTATYLAHPDLSNVTSWRLFAVAVVALIAGRALRYLGLGHISAAEQWRQFGVSAYHLSICLAIASLALMFPPLRSPAMALLALALPVLYLFIRAETGRDSDYRQSASVLAALLVLLSLFRSAFILALFPESMGEVGRHDHYHDNAAVMLGLSLILLRCYGLGADRLFAMLGGWVLMISSWFLITALPGLSPFKDMYAAAWVAIVLAHAFTLMTDQRSPLQQGLLRMLNGDTTAWHQLRREWGLFLLLAVQTAVLCGLLLHTDFIAGGANVLLLGGASLFLHHGFIKRSRVYLQLAFFEVLLALHIGALLPNGWSMAVASWSVLLVWALLLVLHHLQEQGRLALKDMRPVFIQALTIGSLCVLTLLHVFDAGYSSAHGVALAVLSCLLAAATPCAPERRAVLWLLFAVPVYLAFTMTQYLGYDWRDGLPLAVALLVLCALAASAQSVQQRALKPGRLTAYATGRLLRLIQDVGLRPVMVMHLLALTGSLLLAIYYCVLQVPPTALQLPIVLMTLAAAQAWAWYQLANERRQVFCLFLAQLALAILMVVLRQLLRHHLPDYTIEYDVWSALLISVLVSGGRQLWEGEPRHIHLPLLWSLAVLPLMTLSWIMLHGLGTDLALIAIALHSVGFAWLGRGHGGRSFQALACVGFVALALLAVWSKFDVRVLHAYAVPVGIGVLSLVHLFSDQLSQEQRNRISGVTLVAMLGSSAWHTFFDHSYPLLFHLSLFVIGLSMLVAGGLLRIRQYTWIGFAGMLLALSSLIVFGLSQVERGLRMSLIGALVLLIGALLVGGTILLKARREQIIAWLDQQRQRFGDWR